MTNKEQVREGYNLQLQVHSFSCYSADSDQERQLRSDLLERRECENHGFARWPIAESRGKERGKKDDT